MQFILVDMIIIYHLGKMSKTFLGGGVDHIHKLTCNYFLIDKIIMYHLGNMSKTSRGGGCIFFTGGGM